MGVTAMETGCPVVWGRFQVHLIGLAGRRAGIAGANSMGLGLKIGLGRGVALGSAVLSIRGIFVSHFGSSLVWGGAITGRSGV